jgi:hypothetical protein
MIPRFVRRAYGRLRGEFVSSAVRREVERLSRGPRRIALGPWLGEVGFELLYWVPFLRWAVEYGHLDPARIVAVSRGGPASWYRGLAGEYRDVFEFVEPVDYREKNERRAREVGEQKQVRRAAFDDELIGRVEAALGESCEWLHPALMYRAMQPYWWKHASIGWVARHARFAKLEPPDAPPGTAEPGTYTAVKFYFNDALRETPDNRAAIGTILRRLTDRGPVIALSSRVSIDDHADANDGLPVGTPREMSASDNLDAQTAIIARSRGFVGTYGGFCYLAPFLGVATTAVYGDERGFDHAHLALARAVFAEVGAPAFEVRELRAALA